MLYFPKTRVSVSIEVPIALNAVIQSEGAALVADYTGGRFGAKLSAGSSGDSFLGISISQEFPLTYMPKVEERVVGTGSTPTLTLARTPVNGTLFVFDVTANAALAITTDWTLSGNVVTFADADQVGHTVRIFYKFAPTAVEARMIMGDVYPGGAAGTSIGQVGLLKSGAVFTTEYDTSVNWQASNPVIKTGANGILTIGGSGATVPGVVVEVPSVTSPYLGIQLSAA